MKIDIKGKAKDDAKREIKALRRRGIVPVEGSKDLYQSVRDPRTNGLIERAAFWMPNPKTVKVVGRHREGGRRARERQLLQAVTRDFNTVAKSPAFAGGVAAERVVHHDPVDVRPTTLAIASWYA